MDETNENEFLEVGKIKAVWLGIADNCYKHALQLSIVFDYEQGGVQSFSREYITTSPLRAILELFGVETLDSLVGRFAYVIRDHDRFSMIIGFYPMRTERRLSKIFRGDDWSHIEKAAAEALKVVLDKMREVG